MKWFTAIFFSCMLFTGGSLYSQLNIKVGYGLAFFDPAGNDAILTAFNDLKAQEFNRRLEKEFGGLNGMHGINVGLRYSLGGSHAFEAGWENLTNSKEALGENSAMGLFRQELFYSANQYHLSYQFRSGLYGFGLGLGSSRIKIKDNIGTSDVRKNIISENQAILRFNLALHFEGNQNVSFSIQPFWHYALDRVGLDDLRSELGLSPDPDSGDSFSRIGINFIFYNGPRS